MNISRKAGKYGEQLAADYLENKGYNLLQTNRHIGRCEVDIIAMDGRVLVFVEVKTRTGSLSYGYPESYVNQRKQHLLLQGADAFIKESSYIGEARFDIVSVRLKRSIGAINPFSLLSIEHFVDAFYGIG
ncbi:MAG: YraN family protein [Bacteroidetes bacterium]|nr:YraN family protein [Bacteroidota bacterium]